uniref:Uncharacterized protein n=1 Tax=Oryza glumipatula TaxID=40148 RepID=A0A0E0ATU3_9ORYZ
MGATLLLLCADFSAVAGGRRRPSLPSEPRLAAPAAGSRAPPSRASVRPSAAAAPLAARGLPHHASVAGNLGVVKHWRLSGLPLIVGQKLEKFTWLHLAWHLLMGYDI